MVISIGGMLAVLGCAVAYSGVDLLRKKLSQRARPALILFYLSLGSVPFFLLWFLWQPTALQSGYWLPGMASVLLNILANLAFLEAVRVSPLSITIPLLSLTPVFTSLLAIPMLGEVPGNRSWFGIALVVLGVFFLNLPKGKRPSYFWSHLRGEPGVPLMIGVSVLWSLAMPLDKIAMTMSGPAFHGLALNAGVAIGTLSLLVVRRRTIELRSGREMLGGYVVAIVLSALALALQLIAISLVWVGLVETMKRSFGSFFAVAAGAAIFHEEITRRMLAAICLMALPSADRAEFAAGENAYGYPN